MTGRLPDRGDDLVEMIVPVIVIIFAGALALQFLGWL
jgi:hypothetical protein